MTLAIIRAKGVAVATLAELQAAQAECNTRISVLQNDLAQIDTEIAAEALNFAAGDTEKHDDLRSRKRVVEGDLSVMQTAVAQINDQIAAVEQWGEQQAVLAKMAEGLRLAERRREAILKARELVNEGYGLRHHADDLVARAQQAIGVPLPGIGRGDIPLMTDSQWLLRQRDESAGLDLIDAIKALRARYCAQVGIPVPTE